MPKFLFRTVQALRKVKEMTNIRKVKKSGKAKIGDKEIKLIRRYDMVYETVYKSVPSETKSWVKGKKHCFAIFEPSSYVRIPKLY